MKKRILHLLRSILIKTRNSFDRIVAPIRSIGSVKDVRRFTSENSKNKDNLLFFLHFDRDNFLDDCVLELLKFYKKSLHADVVLISNVSFDVLKDKVESLNLYGFLQRKNVGRDFYGWKTALSLFETEVKSCNKLFLANDSVYGPIYPEFNFFNHTEEANEPTFIGMIDSFETSYHVQSFFMCFNRACVQSSVFQSFWNSVKCLEVKSEVVRCYEVGLSQLLLKSGIEVKALFDYRDLRKNCEDVKIENITEGADHRVKPVNPTCYFAKELVKVFKFPLIKVSYLRDNPYGELDSYRVMDDIQTESPMLASKIDRHLKRVGNFSQF